MSGSVEHALIYRSFGAGRKRSLTRFFTFTKTLRTWILDKRGIHLPIKPFYVSLEQSFAVHPFFSLGLV